MTFINTQDYLDFGGKNIVCNQVYAGFTKPEQIAYNTVLPAPLGGGGGGGVTNPLPQRSVTSSPVIQGTDVIINCRFSSPTTINLPLSSTRAGLQLIFVDAGNNAGTNNITIIPASSDNIVNWTTPTSLVLNGNGMVVALYPFNDGISNGWFLA